MKRTILITLTAFILAILPFLAGTAISKYSPYIETNSFKAYVILWAVISIAFTSIVLLLLKYYAQSFGSLQIGGASLFLLFCPIAGIVGLASGPDISLKMLQHPEREHLRYIFLFIATILFGIFYLVLLKGNALKISKTSRWIVTIFFILAFTEFIWEFAYHYSYPEALKEWISQGGNAEEFAKNYNNINVIQMGVFGRFIEFSLILWLSVHLYRLRQIKIWSPIITIIFSFLGVVSAIMVYITQMNLPKGFEILFLFFIPGIPFLLLYWLGVALLTKFGEGKMTI